MPKSSINFDDITLTQLECLRRYFYVGSRSASIRRVVSYAYRNLYENDVNFREIVKSVNAK